MNTKEFAQRCNVSPQVVRLWLRSGRLVRRERDIQLAEGFVLLPRMTIKRERGCGRTVILPSETGVTPRTLFNWLRTGKVVKDEYGALYVGDGLELQMSYHPVRRKEIKGEEK